MRARICPENGATVNIIETASGRGEIVQAEDLSAFPEGIMLVALANQRSVEIHDGTIEIPEGATVEIHWRQTHLATIEVHRGNTKPMIHIPGEIHPNSKKPLFHHVDGSGQYGATTIPDELYPVASIWCYDPKNQE